MYFDILVCHAHMAADFVRKMVAVIVGICREAY